MKPDLVIDTSGNQGLLAMVKQDTVIQEFRLQTGRHSNPALFQSAIASLLRDCGKPGKIVVGLGPGNHSSVRVGIATAIGLSIGLTVKVYGIPSPYGFEAMSNDYVAIGKAGRDEFWNYRVTDSKTTTVATLMNAQQLNSIENELLTIDGSLIGLATVVPLSAVRLSNAASQHEAAKPLEPIYLRSANITLAKTLPQVQWRDDSNQR